jgi:uncharacterized protein (TIGR02646 family)
MIRVVRGAVPQELEDLGAEELGRFRAIALPSSEDIGTAYRKWAPLLRKQQHFKCCYCEQPVQESYNDVEHFRPKAAADRRPGSTETFGYWWLAWTWENLLFACPTCNRKYKNDRFPLEVGSVVLEAEKEAPGPEVALLIDPAAEDPVLEICFAESPFQRGRFEPEGRRGSRRGSMTIEVCGLGRDELMDLYDNRVRDLEPKIADVLRAMDERDQLVVASSWQRLLRELRQVNDFLGLTYDVIDQRIPQDERQTWGLTLPLPPYEPVSK